MTCCAGDGANDSAPTNTMNQSAMIWPPMPIKATANLRGVDGAPVGQGHPQPGEERGEEDDQDGLEFS